MTEPLRRSNSADAEDVIAFLRENPAWLAEQPELYRILAPPVRLHGDALTDHMAAMLRAERAHAAAMTAQVENVLAAGRATAGLATRVQAAVLALIRTHDPADCVSAELPGILAVDAASLCIEDHVQGMRHIPTGTVSLLLDGRDVVFRDAPDDALLLHAEAARLARHDALVRVPGGGKPALLALVTRDRPGLDPTQGTGALGFLGRALAAALGR
jgi:uncharacterized protein YigA (DUF484 family)